MINMFETIKISEFGRDHWSLLLYLEDRATNNSGIIDNRHMRWNSHHSVMRGPTLSLGWDDKNSTRLRDKTVLGHDDWDCLDDLEENNLIINNGSSLHPIITISTIGMEWVMRLRIKRQSKKQKWTEFYELYREFLK